MSKKKIAFSFISSLFLFLLFPWIFLQGSGSIKGFVTDFESHAPMKDIKVLLLDCNQETKTDDQGAYQFLDVPLGSQHVQIELPSPYVTLGHNPLKIEVDTLDEVANFSLSIPGNIMGYVLDATTSLPIVNAQVDVMRGNNRSASTLTDENGFYFISALAPQPYVIRVKASHFRLTSKLGFPTPNQTVRVDFSLHPPPGKIIGQVIHHVTGLPLQGVTIEIIERGFIIDSTQTDIHGNYMLSRSVPNEYFIKAVLDEFQTIQRKITLLTDQILQVDIALEPYGVSSGQVVHTFTGQPIIGACVGIWKNDELLDHILTDENGYFHLKGLGSCVLVVQASHFHTLETAVEIPSLQTIKVHINLVCLEPLSPRKLKGKVMYKRSARQTNRIHRLQWLPSSDPTVVSYHIYRNKILIAQIAKEESLIYYDIWQEEKEVKYQLKAVNAFGQESLPIEITIK